MSDASLAAGTGGGLDRLRRLVEGERFQTVLIWLIVANAVVLGLETSATLREAIGPALTFVDRAILAVFVAELCVKLAVYRLSFFRSGWNVFDFAVIAVALVPAAGSLSALRALRVLRVLRLITFFPAMREVVEAMFRALPGIGSIAALLGLILYVSAVLATGLFGQISPDLFGSMGASLFTLFTVMTVEGWPDVAREVMAQQPWAWLFFVVFLLACTFTVLNLFIGIIVNSMEELHDERNRAARQAAEDRQDAGMADVLAKLAALETQVANLVQALEKRG